MLFSNAIEKLSSEVTKNKDDKDTLDKIKNALNFGRSEVSKYSLWRNLEVPNSELTIIPQYSTGTASVTKDSRTVSLGGGASVVSDFKGRIFKGQTSAGPYEISDVDTSANTITLKTPIIEDSGTFTYTIWKKYYRIPSDVRVVLPNEEYSDMPSPFEVHGYDPYASSYNVTAVVVKGSNILTGSGTSFFDNVYPGDMVTIESNIYRVRRIQSDTKCILVNKALTDYSGSVTFSSDTPYVARLVGYNNQFTNNFTPASNQSTKTILNFSYIRTLYDMVSDDDNTELPVYFDRAILDFAKAEFGRVTNVLGWKDDLNLAQARLVKLEYDKDLIWESKREFNMSIPSGMGRGRYSRWRTF
jgi:hypothetical protein